VSDIVLYDYWRSSAAYRVRIALELKGVVYSRVSVHLMKGEQAAPAYAALNPQKLVPALAIDGHVLTQSLAIIDYLDANYPDPRMVSSDAAARSHTLAQALAIAADIHPLDNLRVLAYLRERLGADEAAVATWYRHWIAEGFAALEAGAPEQGLFGGDAPNLADVCLVPQMANARRFDTPLSGYPRLARIDAALRALPAFERASPEAIGPPA
jgi:maleylacetoacetate isomerase